MNIVENGVKVDFHIHSVASKHKEESGKVDNSTIENLNVLIQKLNDRKINMCSISDHDNFDIDIYKKLKEQENIDTIKKVLPAIEFSVKYDSKILHIITIFEDNDEEKLKKIQSLIFNVKTNKPLYDQKEAFSEEKFLEIIKEIDLNVIMIAHQKETLSSKKTRSNDVMSLGKEKFNELVFLDYFESFEFKNKRNEIFNKYYIENNKDNLKSKDLRFITGSDCHKWNEYPEEDENFSFTYLKCLPTFRGLAMAVTNVKRIKLVNSFFTSSDNKVDNIKININGKEKIIPLSRGINAIIGDNSIGKSLLIHKLTNYEYLSNKKIQEKYEEYLIKNNIQINSTIEQDKIYRFDKQGAVREMFEKKTFNVKGFLNSYFPPIPNVEKYKTKVKDEIELYIENIKNNYDYEEKRKDITNISIKVFEENAKSLNIQKSKKNYTVKIQKINDIIAEFDDINIKLDKLIKNKNILEEDVTVLKEQKELYNTLIDKYKKEVEKWNFKDKKIKIINEILGELSQILQKSKTDNTKAIDSYENSLEAFEDNIVNLYLQSKKERKYQPNIENEKIPIEYNCIGKYRFINKCEVEEISNDYIIKSIQKVVGKRVKDVNDLTENNISDKIEGIDFFDKLNSLKKIMFENIELDFKYKPVINNLDDKDVTKELSSGFNAKIYFDILSEQTQKDGIFIIDQPEDDVSQKSIKEYLLEDFYNMCQNRQIILITHNPQFIVNLDVDNVIYLGKNDDNEIIIQSGALEFVNKECDILKIVADNIDGGIGSINERWKRYEKNI
ncbi:MAG: hypothetical protein UE116_03160 [Clostridia bacterium]|nr:hypothetical protein [Clostridia bacterium]